MNAVKRLEQLELDGHIESFISFTPGIGNYLHHLEYCIPAIIGNKFVPYHIRNITSLPARMGGLCIQNCTTTAGVEYSNSVEATKQLTDAIFQQHTTFQPNEEKQIEAINTVKDRKEELYKLQRETILNRSPPTTKRQLELISEGSLHLADHTPSQGLRLCSK